MPTILIVDDLPTNRDVLVTLLRGHGHTLLEAEDGREGLAVAHANHVDLIITDVLMPAMDGYEFVRQLRHSPATSGVPVAFYTAHYVTGEARALAGSMGVSDVLVKPSTTLDLLRMVDRLVSAPEVPAAASVAVATDFDREHLRLISNKLSESVADRMDALSRQQRLISIGLEFASGRSADRRLQRMGDEVCALFRASYVTIGTLGPHDRTVRAFVASGVDARDVFKAGDPLSGMLETVIHDRRPLRGVNPGGDPRRLHLPRRHPDVLAFLTVPIASATRTYGWICLVGTDGKTFDENEEQLAMSLAGHVGRIYELEHEIDERQQAEAALRRERDLAQSYLDTAEVILLALDLENRITLINRKGCALLGWSAGELTGRDWIETCVPARMREASRKRFRGLATNELFVGDGLVLTRTGEERLIEWRNTLQRNDRGQVIGIFGSGADITERQQAVSALRTAEDRMRFVLESADVGIWDMDYATGKLQWSEILEAQHGLRPGTFGGTLEAHVERIHPDDRESVLATRARATTHGGDFTIANRVVWPDGTIRWLHGAGRVLRNEAGQPVRGVGVSLDDTQRRMLEEQYRQAQKMESVGQLAGGVAHDFNNVLTVIEGYCELLAERPLDEPSRAAVNEIANASARATGLTRQLLDFSRKQIIEPTVLDVNALVRNLRSMLERLIGGGIRIVATLDAVSALVCADRGQIEQVVMNLVVNARDAMSAGGLLTIATADVAVGADCPTMHVAMTPGPYVRLTVSDTGTGMTPQVQARLFEPFFTTKEPGKGTGLGMATVYSVVSRSKGCITVDSEVGKGTTFQVFLPKISAAVTIDSRPPFRGRLAGAETLLVVDDQAEVRIVTARLLEQQGYTVISATGAAEAIRLFAENPSIALLVTDVVMPGSSGLDLTSELIRQRPALKVIYVSGCTEEAVVHDGGFATGMAFLSKPYSSDGLAAKVRELLDA